MRRYTLRPARPLQRERSDGTELRRLGLQHVTSFGRRVAQVCASERGLNMMSVLLWVLFGLVVGVIAKLVTPGREPGGFAVTVLLGIGGALVGGFLSRLIGVATTNTSPAGFLMSILGAVVLLGIYNLAIGRRMDT